MLEKSVAALKGIGPVKASMLKEQIGIETIEDLLYYAPRRYLDRSLFKPLCDVFDNETLTVGGKIIKCETIPSRKPFLRVIISDGTDTLNLMFFGGLKYFKNIFTSGEYVLCSGTVRIRREKQMVHPEFDFADSPDSETLNTARIIPLYSSTETLRNNGLDARGIRKIVRNALDLCKDQIIEPFSDEMQKREKIIPLKKALELLHFPETMEEVSSSRRRLAFNEIFAFQYYLATAKQKMRSCPQKKIRKPDRDLLKSMLSALPFSLTQDQVNAIEDIENDICSTVPMNRLLQGDVGSGKTVVALSAAMLACARKSQAAFMAPTEILARQHFQTFKKFIPEGIICEILTGSNTDTEKKEILQKLSTGAIDIIIGTHALIQGNVIFNDLSLVIIDEQHRFGVEQRALLRNKGDMTDLLVMTATPIPRSLSMTVYGDLDCSILKTKPAQRGGIKTLSFPDTRLKAVYNSLMKYMSQGRQIYYILPLIDESEKIDLQSAVQKHALLSNEIFPDKRVALLHGKLKSDEKEEIMTEFTRGNIDLIVSTTVLEVGIDVPNATVIVIEHAERFGLSQLHQLRGRVGRGAHESFCVLIYPEKLQPENKKRIEILCETDDGFTISEEDLRIRGAGELLGTHQHGKQGDFEFTHFEEDLALIISAREAARQHIETGDVTDIGDEITPAKFIRKNFPGLRTKAILSILS